MYVQPYQVQPKIFSTKFDKIFHFLFKGIFRLLGRNTGLVWIKVSKNYDLKQNKFYSKAFISKSFSRLFTLEQKHKLTLWKMCVFYIFRYFQSSVSVSVNLPQRDNFNNTLENFLNVHLNPCFFVLSVSLSIYSVIVFRSDFR